MCARHLDQREGSFHAHTRLPPAIKTTFRLSGFSDELKAWASEKEFFWESKVLILVVLSFVEFGSFSKNGFDFWPVKTISRLSNNQPTPMG
jgi:hypothetical protein